jgi:hypothetical protein
VALACLAVGFVLGACCIKRSGRWCPACGYTVRCPHCPGEPTPGEALVRESALRSPVDPAEYHLLATLEVEQSLRSARS